MDEMALEVRLALGARLRQLRERSVMSQRAAAEALGMTQQELSRWECGLVWPRSDSVALLLHRYNAVPEDLVMLAEVSDES